MRLWDDSLTDWQTSEISELLFPTKRLYLLDIVLSDGVLRWIRTIVTLRSIEMKNRTVALVTIRTMMTLWLYSVVMSRISGMWLVSFWLVISWSGERSAGDWRSHRAGLTPGPGPAGGRVRPSGAGTKSSTLSSGMQNVQSWQSFVWPMVCLTQLRLSVVKIAVSGVYLQLDAFPPCWICNR